MNKGDLVIPRELIDSIGEYSTEDVGKFMANLFPAIVNLFKSKDANYGGSWQNKGILSAQMNFERKIDRVNTQFYNGTISKETNENIADTFIDTSCYSLMYLFFLCSKNPKIQQQVDKFIQEWGNKEQ